MPVGTSTCNRCGEPVAAGTRFCANCGADVSSEQSNAATRRFTPISTTIAAQNELLARLRRAALGEYEVLAELGRGGMASVFLAHDIQLDRKVAIKVMLPQLVEGEGMAERFKLEARTAAALSHANIIPIFAVRDTDLLVFFVMKFVEGRPLDTILREVGKAPLPMVRSIISKVGDALGYAHRRGVVHRDIKPANLMIDTEGQPVVTDFGIAKVAASAGLTMTGATIGTPAYMSPEQASSGQITGASDQYSLGVVAYQMLTGRLPFQADSMVSLMYMHCHEPAPPFMQERPDCPPELHDAVMRMLAKTPEERFPDLETAVEAIGRVHLSTSDPVQTQLMDLAKRGGNRAILDQVKTPRSPIVTRSKPTSGASALANAPTTPSGAAHAPGMSSGPQHATQPQTIVVQQSAAPWIVTIFVVILAAVGLIYFIVQQKDQARTPSSVEGPQASPSGGDRGASVGVRTDSNAGTGATSTPPPRTESPTRAASNAPTGSPAPATPSSGGQANAPANSPANAPVNAPVPTRVTAVTVSPSGRALDAGATVRLTADLTTNDGRPSVDATTWRSSAPSVATVSGDGTVTAVSPGSATITASAGGTEGTATVRVNEPAAAPPAAPAAPTVSARDQIATTVERYVKALESRQISELRSVYPGMTPEQEAQLTQALRAMEQLDVTLAVNSLDVRGNAATAMISGTYDFYSRDSRRRERLPVNVQMTLAQGASGWLIQQIRSVR